MLPVHARNPARHFPGGTKGLDPFATFLEGIIEEARLARCRGAT